MRGIWRSSTQSVNGSGMITSRMWWFYDTISCVGGFAPLTLNNVVLQWKSAIRETYISSVSLHSANTNHKFVLHWHLSPPGQATNHPPNKNSLTHPLYDIKWVCCKFTEIFECSSYLWLEKWSHFSRSSGIPAACRICIYGLVNIRNDLQWLAVSHCRTLT